MPSEPFILGRLVRERKGLTLWCPYSIWLVTPFTYGARLDEKSEVGKLFCGTTGVLTTEVEGNVRLQIATDKKGSF